MIALQSIINGWRLERVNEQRACSMLRPEYLEENKKQGMEIGDVSYFLISYIT